MSREFYLLLLLLLTPSASAGQKYGRPYTLAEIPNSFSKLRFRIRAATFTFPTCGRCSAPP
jgi:hypothetical protein